MNKYYISGNLVSHEDLRGGKDHTGGKFCPLPAYEIQSADQRADTMWCRYKKLRNKNSAHLAARMPVQGTVVYRSGLMSKGSISRVNPEPWV